ncbi:FKBP-type peptidyl-prolyl cis-trans isomerase [Xanthovirga aplysinae]|uniref:FKBP-type peptidyl-prolyl cis-trans isomerase n=1 Tax=Xanthovirga aplysinae TaxID=2529853 RepID=UPI0012BB77EB|nr:FKBP-type peptidyl-prolyl cis-trans isomerase [Xanthovirga aplysinae]MTI32406.1 hypothetical protein [Xanthovirga aplysinae]
MKNRTFRNSLFMLLTVVTVILSGCKKDQYTKDKELIDAYLKKNNITGTVTTESGLVYRVISNPDGDLDRGYYIPDRNVPKVNEIFADIGQTVRLNYEGRFLDDVVFDRNSAGNPLQTPIGVGGLVPGFDEGVLQMPENAVFEFYIPSKLGYGSRGSTGVPANSVLIFEVELVNIIQTGWEDSEE